MNHLIKLEELHNRYFVQRHGQSHANKSNIILSHPKHGKYKEFGLTNLGRMQVKKAAMEAQFLDSATVIYSSYFSRASETAKITQEVLNASSVHYSKHLRERYFGKWERTNLKNYHKVWKEDFKNSAHKIYEVESVEEVLNRVTKLILKLDNKYRNRKILLVAHGDVIEILEIGFRKINASRRHELKPIKVAEIRELKLSEN